MKQRVEARLGRPLTHAASGYPPGVLISRSALDSKLWLKGQACTAQS
jgi:Ethanolamine utilization protein EutJ (predicted chaperonin)